MSNTNKHTPGPWHRGARCRENIQIITVNPKTDEPNGVVAYINNLAWCNEEITRANARLIASAPDLLEALKSLCESFKCHNEDYDLHDSYKLARAAIAKATP